MGGDSPLLAQTVADPPSCMRVWNRELLHLLPPCCLPAAVVQETARLVRCRDSPVNSVLGGAATGALLYKSHGRCLAGRGAWWVLLLAAGVFCCLQAHGALSCPHCLVVHPSPSVHTTHPRSETGRPGAPGSIICAAIAGAAHLAAARVDAAGGLQQLLISMDLLDPPPPPLPGTPEAAALEAAAAAAVVAKQAAAEAEQARLAARPWWHKYMPVRKMSDVEWEEYKAQQDDTQRKR